MYIRETLAPLLAMRMVSDHRPVLGVDEGLNDIQHVEPMICRLVANGIVSMATPLWYQSRITSDGTSMNILGGKISESPLVPDTGRPRRGTSWPDEGVVAQLIAYFSTTNQFAYTEHQE